MRHRKHIEGKNIEGKNIVDFALLVRTALSVLEEYEYDIINATDEKLIKSAIALSYTEALYISEGYREYANYSAEKCMIHLEHIISQHSDYLLSLIKEIHDVVMSNRRELLEKLSNNSNSPPVMPPDHIIF